MLETRIELNSWGSMPTGEMHLVPQSLTFLIVIPTTLTLHGSLTVVASVARLDIVKDVTKPPQLADSQSQQRIRKLAEVHIGKLHCAQYPTTPGYAHLSDFFG